MSHKLQDLIWRKSTFFLVRQHQVIQVVSRHFRPRTLRPKTFRHYQTGAEVSGLGMLTIIEKAIIETDSRSRVSIIDFRNALAMRTMAAASTERLLASLVIKLKPSPQLTLHGRPSCVAVACGGLAADWPAQ